MFKQNGKINSKRKILFNVPKSNPLKNQSLFPLAGKRDD